MKRMWCEYTCAPDQEKYVKNNGYDEVQDPADPNNILRVLNQTVTLNSESTCNLFESCKRTPYVTQVSAMQTAVGFVKFQGKNGVS